MLRKKEKKNKLMSAVENFPRDTFKEGINFNGIVYYCKEESGRQSIFCFILI